MRILPEVPPEVSPDELLINGERYIVIPPNEEIDWSIPMRGYALSNPEYVTINLRAMKDAQLSSKAKGILYTILTTRNLTNEELPKQLTKIMSDGITAIYSGLIKLRELHYVECYKTYGRITAGSLRVGLTGRLYVASPQPIEMNATKLEAIRERTHHDKLVLELVDLGFVDQGNLNQQESLSNKGGNRGEESTKQYIYKSKNKSKSKNSNSTLNSSNLFVRTPRMVKAEKTRLRKKAETLRICGPLAERLREILSTRLKVDNTANMTSWTDTFRKMHDVNGFSYERIKLALDNLSKSEIIDNQYCPFIESAGALRNKFIRFEAHVQRINPHRGLPKPLRPEGSPPRNRILS